MTNPKQTIFSIKRFMGRRMDEIKEEVKRVPYKVESGPKRLAAVRFAGKKYNPARVSAMILQKMKQTAEDYSASRGPAVIHVPATSTTPQRQATKDACKIAVWRCSGSSTAHRRRAGLRARQDEKEKIAVFVPGGAPTTSSRAGARRRRVRGQEHQRRQPPMGGDDFDQRLIDWW